MVGWELEFRSPRSSLYLKAKPLGPLLTVVLQLWQELQHPLWCSEPGKSEPHPGSGYSSLFCIPRVLRQALQATLQTWTPELSSALLLLVPGPSLQPLQVPSPAGFLPVLLLRLSTSLLPSLSLCFSPVLSLRPRGSGGLGSSALPHPLFVWVSCPSFFLLVLGSHTKVPGRPWVAFFGPPAVTPGIGNSAAVEGS